MDNLYPEIPGFQILEMLPNAGMSRVYKARQLSLDRIVVLKVLPHNMVKDKADIERFAEEARITAQLKHSNIVQIYDFSSTQDGIYYFVMEFVSGYSMGSWIRRKGRLTEENALVCAQCVAVAMNYAWERARVVHCDIKPDNIMIDGDGTIKVADLGLARSLVIFHNKQEDDMVYGTPNYISPEQARGEPDIDCRADIYSLGATLYHAVTGIMPFEEKKDADVMELQVTSYIPDALDVNPALSIATACLIEKMMAKDKKYRHRNWEELLKDIVRARSEKPPLGKMPPEGESTVLRNKVRQEFIANIERIKSQKEVSPKRSSTVLIKPTRTRSTIARNDKAFENFFARVPKELFIIGILVAMFVFGLMLLMQTVSKKRTLRASGNIQTSKVEISNVLTTQTVSQLVYTQATPAPITQHQQNIPQKVEDKVEDKEASAQVMFETALEWYRMNSNDFDGAILRFQKISDETRGTKYSILALSELDKIKKQKEQTYLNVIAALNSNIAILESQNQYDKAISLLESYNGILAKETEQERMEQITKLNEKKQHWLAQQIELQKKTEKILEEVFILLLSDDASNALNKASTYLEENKTTSIQQQLKTVLSLIHSWNSVEEGLAKSFLEHKGQDIKVKFLKSEDLMFIRDVEDNRIIAEKVNIINAGRISRSAPFKVSDLSLDEKLARLTFITNKMELAFNKAFLFMQHTEYDKALESISSLPDWLRNPMQKSFLEYKAKIIENKALQELYQILYTYRLVSTNVSPNVQETINVLHSTKLSQIQLNSLNKLLTNWSQRYQQCSITKSFSPLIEEVQSISASINTNVVIDTKTEKIEKSEHAQSENKATQSSVESLLTKLIELNPLMSMANIKISLDDDRKIKTMEIVFKDLKDISPMAEMGSLKELVIMPGYFGDNEWQAHTVTMPLNNISPLKGLPLRRLIIKRSSIKDISPLQGMPLEFLDLSFSGVSDISPLQNMPLRRLILRGTAITNLEPLRNMQLEMLDVSSTKIKKIDVLAGMPLKSLNIRKTDVEELSPLLKTPIEELFIDFDMEEFLRGYNNELRRFIKKSETLRFINGRPIPPDRNFRR